MKRTTMFTRRFGSLSLALAAGVACLSMAPVAKAATVTDDFNTSYDYKAGGNVANGIWDGFFYNVNTHGFTGDTILNTANANTTTAGMLTLSSQNGTWEGTANDGVLLYRNVIGDFTAQVYVNSANNAVYNEVGLMARWAGGAAESWLEGRYSAWSSASNVRQVGATPTDPASAVSGLHKYLKLNRAGDVFTYSVSDDGNTWTTANTITRTDLAGKTLQVGIAEATYTATANVTATFDNFSLTTPGPQTWNTGSSTWDTSTANWTVADGTIWGNGNDAIFGGTAGSTITINVAGITAKSLTFDVTGDTIARDSTYTLTLSGAGGSVTVGSGLTATISAPIAGTVGLTKADTGTLILSGANTYSGPTIITGGTLQIGVSTIIQSFTSNGNWTAPAGVSSVNYWVVGGGGGGGGATGGGGGGGQVLTGTLSVTPGNSYPVTVGGGGGGGPSGSRTTSGYTGGSSSFNTTIIAAGGGGGGTQDTYPISNTGIGSAGGGGGWGRANPITGGTQSDPAKGYSGGSGVSDNSTYFNGGGGGGAGIVGGVGGTANGTKAGNGGSGVLYSITGLYYGAGGGGGAYATGSTGGAGGSGGVDGHGGTLGVGLTAGANGTGNGGGGAGSGNGASGGNGIVVLSYSSFAALPSTTALSIGADSTLDLNGSSQTAASLSVAGTGVSSGGAVINSAASTPATLTCPITLSANSSMGGTGNLTIASAISESGGSKSLTKVGAGTLTLSVANTYSGDTIVEGGTLSMASSDCLADGADVYLTNGSTLNLTHGATDTIRSLYIDGVKQALGTWGPNGGHTSQWITGSGTLTVTVSKTPQTITFPLMSQKTTSTPDFAPATASSALPVTYASDDADVATGGLSIHIVGAGTAHITASQGGDATYDPAPNQTQTLMVDDRTPQTITFPVLPTMTYGDLDLDPGATGGGSGNPVTYTSGNEAVATITGGGLIHIVGQGTATITASQAGSGTHAPALDVPQALTVNKKALTVTATGPTTKTCGTTLTLGSSTENFEVSGTVLGESVSSVTLTPSGPGVVNTAPVGTSYTVTPSAAIGLDLNNYAVTYTDYTGGTVQLGTFTWNTASANWDTTAANWTGTKWVSGNDAIFGGTALSTITINETSISANSVTFNVDGDTIARNLAYTLTLSGAGGNVTVGNGLIATIAAPIAGAVGLTKADTGTLILSGANTYSGATAINGGTLKLSGGQAVSVPLTNPSFEIDAGTANGWQNMSITGWTKTAGGIEQGSSRTWAPAQNLNYNATTNFKWAWIQGVQTLSQTINVTTPGVYTVSFVAAGRPAVGFGPLNIQVQIDGVNQSAVFTPSTSAWATYNSYSVPLSAGSHTLGFVFINALGGDKASVLDAVTVSGTAGNLPATTSLSIADDSALDLNGISQTAASLSVAGTGVGGGGALINSAASTPATLTCPITLSANSSMGGDGNLTIASAIGESGSGSKSLTKVGIGTLTLSVANNYTGDTIVQGGTLSMANACLADGADVYLPASGTPLNLTHSAPDTIRRLYINGVSQASGTWGVTGDTGANYTSPYITGTVGSRLLVTERKTAQTITFNALPVMSTSDADFDPGATASSGLTVSYASDNPAVATITGGGLIHIEGQGSATITASQAGDATYDPAPTQTQTLTVDDRTPQMITFAAPTKTYGDADFDPGATGGGSGNPVTYTSSNTGVATITGDNMIHIVAQGTATITATQAGGGTFRQATSVQQTLTVNKKPLTVTATGPSKTYGTALAPVTGAGNFTPDPTGVGIEAVTGVTLTPDAAGAAANTAAGAAYAVTPSAATGAGTGFLESNYLMTYTPYNGTVAKKPLTVTATGPQKTYGTVLTTLTGAGSVGKFTTTATVGSEAVTGVTLTPDAAGLSTLTPIGAVYTVTPSAALGTGNFLEANYLVTYVDYNGTVKSGLINWDFAGDKPTGAAVIGSAADYWNQGNNPSDLGGWRTVTTITDAPSPLNDSVNAATSVGLTLYSKNVRTADGLKTHNNNTPVKFHNAFDAGYGYPADGNPMDYTITGLTPGAKYNVYVLYGWGATTAGGYGDIYAYGGTTRGGNGTTKQTVSYAGASANPVLGRDYVLFSGVVATGGAIDICSRNFSDQDNGVTGFQIQQFTIDFTWNGTSDVLWGTADNWTPAGGPPSAGSSVLFNNAGNSRTNVDLGGGVTVAVITFETASAADYTIGTGGAGSQTLTLNAGGAIAVNSTVTTNQTIDANVVLGSTGGDGAYTLSNGATGSLLTLAGALSSATTGVKTLTVNGAGNTLIGGNISNGAEGTLVLTKAGAGTLTLSGVNTYSGDTTVEAGVLRISSECLADGADVYLKTGGQLDLNFSGDADDVRSLYFDGVPQTTGLWGASGSGAAHTNDTFFSGAGTLNVLVTTGSVPSTANFTCAPTNGYAPLVVTFTDTSTGTITNRHWDFGNGTLDTAATLVTNTYAGVGAYAVQLTISGPDGSSTATHSNLVNVLQVPQPAFADGSEFSVNPSGEATFHILTTNGVQYRMVYNDNLLNASGWTNAVTPPIPEGWTNGNGALITSQDTNTVGVTQRFYRIEAKSADAP